MSAHCGLGDCIYCTHAVGRSLYMCMYSVSTRQSHRTRLHGLRLDTDTNNVRDCSAKGKRRVCVASYFGSEVCHNRVVTPARAPAEC